MITQIDTLPEQNMTLERLKSLYELIARMNSEHDLQTLLEFVVDRALSLTGGKRGLLLLSDDHDRTLEHIAVVRGQNADRQRLEEALEFVSTTVIKDVLAQGEPRIVSDLRLDQRYEHKASQATLQFKKVRSVMAVPLKIIDQLVGLIYIDHPRQATFDQEDLDFLNAFSNQGAMAIKRARESQRQLEDLTRLNKLSQSVVQVLDLNQVLTRIVDEALHMLNAANGSVLLLDEATNQLSFAVSVANGEHINIPVHLQKGQGIAGWVIAHKKPVCVNDTPQDGRWFGEVESDFVTRSLLCVPLQLNERVLGVLQVLNKKTLPGFSQTDITLLSAFATSATIAIENARLFQEAREARLLRALNQIALKLNSTLDLNTILNMGLEQSLHLLKADAGAISLDDQELDQSHIVKISQGLCTDKEMVDQQLHTITEMSNRVLEEGGEEVLIITQPHEYLQSKCLFDAGINVMAVVPVKVEGRINVVLTIMNKTAKTYNEEEIDLLTGIARIVGLAVQNATHYNQMRSHALHVTYLNDIGSALTSSLDLNRVLQVVIDGVNTFLETERTSVFLIDPDTDELVLRYSNDDAADIRLPRPWQGIAGWVATHDKPALVNDAFKDPRHLHKVAEETGYEPHSILCVPLKIKDQIIGVVEVLNKQGNTPFTYKHQSQLMEFTNWAAIALHNARLFDERVQAYQKLTNEQERRIAAEARGAMAAIILNMAHTMNNVVGAIRVWASKLAYNAENMPQTPIGQFRKEITKIGENTQETIKLISNMTNPLEEVNVTATDVHAILEQAIHSCWWPDNVVLEKNYSQQLPSVKANGRRLEAVFHNLISNANQVLALSGGKITLTTKVTPEGAVKVIVSDNGPGIPPELQAQIFKPGISGKHGGLGIGLWLAETFIDQINGNIKFITTPEKGTTFEVTLQPFQERLN